MSYSTNSSSTLCEASQARSPAFAVPSLQLQTSRSLARRRPRFHIRTPATVEHPTERPSRTSSFIDVPVRSRAFNCVNLSPLSTLYSTCSLYTTPIIPTFHLSRHLNFLAAARRIPKRASLFRSTLLLFLSFFSLPAGLVNGPNVRILYRASARFVIVSSSSSSSAATAAQTVRTSCHARMVRGQKKCSGCVEPDNDGGRENIQSYGTTDESDFFF